MFVRERTYYEATQVNKLRDHPMVDPLPDDDNLFVVWIPSTRTHEYVEPGEWILEKNGQVVRVVSNDDFHNEYEMDD